MKEEIVKLWNEYQDFLKKENLQACGFDNFESFIYWCEYGELNI